VGIRPLDAYGRLGAGFPHGYALLVCISACDVRHISQEAFQKLLFGRLYTLWVLLQGTAFPSEVSGASPHEPLSFLRGSLRSPLMVSSPLLVAASGALWAPLAGWVGFVYGHPWSLSCRPASFVAAMSGFGPT
jgi:hypothetical protein